MEYFHYDLIDVKWFSLFWWVINVVLFPVGIWSFCNRKLASLCLFLFNFSPTVIFHLSKLEAKSSEFSKRFHKRYRDDCFFFCLLQKPVICLHFFVSSWNCCYYNFVNCSNFCVVYFSLFWTLCLAKLRCIFSIIDAYQLFEVFENLNLNKPKSKLYCVIFFNFSRFSKL